MGAFAALDRMRQDVLNAGLGLTIPVQLGILQGVTRNEEELGVRSKEEGLIATANLMAGQSRIWLESVKNVKKGREICFFDGDKGECHLVSSVDQDSVVLESYLDFSYRLEEVDIILLRKISLFFDESSRILRRKVNASPAQPLLEEVASFNFDHSSQSNLVRLSLGLEENKEKNHEIFVFTKNTAMAHLH